MGVGAKGLVVNGCGHEKVVVSGYSDGKLVAKKFHMKIARGNTCNMKWIREIY